MLAGELLADVRHLREVVAAEVEEAEKELPSKRLSLLHEEGDNLKDAASSRAYDDPVLEAAAESNDIAKWTMDVERCLQNVAPELLPEWEGQ